MKTESLHVGTDSCMKLEGREGCMRWAVHLQRSESPWAQPSTAPPSAMSMWRLARAGEGPWPGDLPATSAAWPLNACTQPPSSHVRCSPMSLVMNHSQYPSVTSFPQMMALPETFSSASLAGIGPLLLGCINARDGFVDQSNPGRTNSERTIDLNRPRPGGALRCLCAGGGRRLECRRPLCTAAAELRGCYFAARPLPHPAPRISAWPTPVSPCCIAARTNVANKISLQYVLNHPHPLQDGRMLLCASAAASHE